MDICTHYIFLIHGWLGTAQDWLYLETILKESLANLKEDEGIRKVVYTPVVNGGQTKDGVKNGAARISQEIEEFIVKDFSDNLPNDDSNSKERHVTISLVGNSLGGLYARASLSSLPQEVTLPNDEKIILHRNLFYTTATPHIGIASHFYLPLGRAFERGFGAANNATGKDMMRSDKEDIVYQLCTDYEKYLLPLTQFRKRVAYVNSFSTDFQVPTLTASFLNKNSSYPHSIVYPSKTSATKETYPDYIAGIVETKQNMEILQQGIKDVDDREEKIRIMSNKLDATGWTKMFVDLRDTLPCPAIPLCCVTDPRVKWTKFALKEEDGEGSNVDGMKSVESKELVKLFYPKGKIQCPIAHTVLAVNMKNAACTKLNAAGRPVMDAIAVKLLNGVDEYKF